MKREMSITHADFLRLLPQLLAGYEYEVNGTIVTAHRNGARILIRLGPEGKRSIASLTLPVTHIDIEFRDFPAPAEQEFIRRFENTYRRGGG